MTDLKIGSFIGVALTSATDNQYDIAALTGVKSAQDSERLKQETNFDYNKIEEQLKSLKKSFISSRLLQTLILSKVPKSSSS